jgi:hypothetical protein
MSRTTGSVSCCCRLRSGHTIARSILGVNLTLIRIGSHIAELDVGVMFVAHYRPAILFCAPDQETVSVTATKRAVGPGFLLIQAVFGASGSRAPDTRSRRPWVSVWRKDPCSPGFSGSRRSSWRPEPGASDPWSRRPWLCNRRCGRWPFTSCSSLLPLAAARLPRFPAERLAPGRRPPSCCEAWATNMAGEGNLCGLGVDAEWR